MNIFTALISIIAAAVAGFSMLTSFDANEQTQKLGASQKISELTSYTNPDDADSLPIVDAANSQTKRITWGNATSALATYFDTVYSPIFSTSAGLAGLLSDETGSGGGFVRATAPTISSASITTPTITTPTFDVGGTDATGDIYYNGGSGVFTRLAIGSSGNLLTVSGGVPAWTDTSSSDSSFGSISVSSTSTLSATTTVQGRIVSAMFGGDGSDGALSVTSGTTTIALGGAHAVTKQYTSIRIDSGTALAFSGQATTSGAVVILKSQGRCDVAGNIYLTGLGGPGGSGATAGAGAGTNGVDSNDWLDVSTHYGSGASVSSGGGGAAGSAAAHSLSMYATSTRLYSGFPMYIIPGSGGGGGGGGLNNAGGDDGSRGGSGGYGSGSIIVECAGGWNFTGQIIARGQGGGAGISPAGDDGGGGGGGGGSGGQVVVIYGFSIADTGTYIVSGGSGGAGAAGFIGQGGDGGGGGGFIYSAGSAGSGNSGSTGGSGGAGGDGYSVRIRNSAY